LFNGSQCVLNLMYTMFPQSVEQLVLHVARLYFLLKEKNKAYANKKNQKNRTKKK